ncbi:MAG TPA: hypothetical protein VD996_10845 [Chitinophagaceae bacterium]|nr:hypothetical protein [Chitinophagaceae bacterium]
MKFISILFLITACIVIGCDKEKDPIIYTGPDFVEFFPVSRSVTTTAAPKRDSFLVQLVGPQRSTATKITFQIDPSSTAVASTDYELLTPAVEIPANSSSAWIKFRLFKVSSTKTLKVNLTNADGTKVSPNYNTFVYTLR